MFDLVLIGIIVIIAIAVGYVLRQNQLSATPNRGELPPVERNLFTLQIGEFVQYLGADWVVEGQLTYNEDGGRLLATPRTTRTLSDRSDLSRSNH